MTPLEALRAKLKPKEAVAMQRTWPQLVNQTTPDDFDPRFIAGVDCSCTRFDRYLFATVVVWDRLNDVVVERASCTMEAPFPYVPGLLSFREAPGAIEAFGQLKSPVDLMIVDGTGRAHPRRFGLGCHIGTILDIPVIGCAKSRLVGTHRELGDKRGSSCSLVHDGEEIGRVVRTRDGIKPVYISVGNRISLKDSVKWILQFCRGVRLPHPIRLSHDYANEVRRQALQKSDTSTK